MHAHETHSREVCAHEMHEIKRQERYRTLGYDDYQWGMRCIRAATRFEGGDRGQVQWTCGLDSLNRGGVSPMASSKSRCFPATKIGNWLSSLEGLTRRLLLHIIHRQNVLRIPLIAEPQPFIQKLQFKYSFIDTVPF